MRIGDLDIEVTTDGKAQRLRVEGRPFGVQTDVTADDLARLAHYLSVQAEALRHDTTGDH